MPVLGVIGVRGADPELLARLHARLEREYLARRPNVGAVFAESEGGAQISMAVSWYR